MSSDVGGTPEVKGMTGHPPAVILLLLLLLLLLSLSTEGMRLKQ